MGFFDSLKNALSSGDDNSTLRGIITSGGQKSTGGHDHRTNKGDDRTPAQKAGDKNRQK